MPDCHGTESGQPTVDTTPTFEAGKFELLRAILAVAPDEAIEQRGSDQGNGWLYNLINEDNTTFGESAWLLVMAELDRRDAENTK